MTSKLTEEEELALSKPVLIDVADDKGVTKTLKAVFKRFTEGRRKIPKSKDQEYEIEWLSVTPTLQPLTFTPTPNLHPHP